jgi:protein-tyrosine phosphatase
MSPVSVLFVCLGNICRSPTAHGVFEAMVRQRGYEGVIAVDSAGTGDWHIGHGPDSRSEQVAKQRGFSLEHLRARQVGSEDFLRFDYVLAMDEQNLRDLQRMCPAAYQGHLSLFLDFHPEAHYREVPDPYYGGEQGFEHVFDLVETASEHLLLDITQRYGI